MMTGIILISVVAFLGVISYRRPRLEQRVFKNIPLADWINILVVPMAMYAGLFLIVRNIMLRPQIAVLDFDSTFILAIGILFLAYAFVGNSIHFVGKVLSRYLPHQPHTLIWQVNEIFHGHLSHYLSYICSILVLFMTALLEMNFPLEIRLPMRAADIIVLAGILFGITGAKVIFYTSAWFGGYNKPIFFMVSFLSLILWALITSLRLDIWYYPVNMFILSLYSSISVTFLARRIRRILRISSRVGWKRVLKLGH